MNGRDEQIGVGHCFSTRASSSACLTKGRCLMSYAKVVPSPQTEQTVGTCHHLKILRLTARTLSVKLKH